VGIIRSSHQAQITIRQITMIPLIALAIISARRNSKTFSSLTAKSGVFPRYNKSFENDFGIQALSIRLHIMQLSVEIDSAEGAAL